MIIIVTNLQIRNQIEICDFLELALPVQVHRQIFHRFPYPRSENNEIIFSNEQKYICGQELHDMVHIHYAIYIK